MAIPAITIVELRLKTTFVETANTAALAAENAVINGDPSQAAALQQASSDAATGLSIAVSDLIAFLQNVAESLAPVILFDQGPPAPPAVGPS
jgi:hypothetical protein